MASAVGVISAEAVIRSRSIFTSSEVVLRTAIGSAFESHLASASDFGSESASHLSDAR